MTLKLSEFEPKFSGIVTKITGEGVIRRRIFDMGLTPGAHVYLRKKAPLGDPIEITVRNYELTLRKQEASFIEVTVSEETEELIKQLKTKKKGRK